MDIDQATGRLGTLPSALAELLGALPDAVIVATADGRIVAVNERLCALARYSVDGIVGRRIETLVPRSVRAQHVASRAAYLAEGGGARPMSPRSDIVLLRSDDSEVPVDVALSSMTFEEQQLVVATVRDASVSRRFEVVAAREHAFLLATNDVSKAVHAGGEVDAVLGLVAQHVRSLLDADFAIVVLPDPDDADTLVVRATDGAPAGPLSGTRHSAEQSKIGWSTEQQDVTLIADGAADARLTRPPGWPPGVGSTLVVPLRAREETIGSLTIAKFAGRAMFEAGDIALVRTFAAHAALAVTFARTHEVIERSRVFEAAAEQSEAQLELQRELVERLEELGREKSEFVSRMSHELRTPLASIIGFVEMMADGDAGPTTAEQDKMLGIVERNGRRLLRLIEDLLLISRVEAGGFAPELRRVDLAEVVGNVLEVSAPAIAAGHLEVEVDLGTETGLVADREQLERALLNLVSNAVKFTPPHGRIRIESASRDREITITVADTGSGIPADEQMHLFTRFFRSSQARADEVPGTGLGLSIVNEIVTRHHGTIDVRSSPEGSSFTLRMPIDGPGAAVPE